MVATIWALVETGFNIWGLEVRLMTLVGIGAWLLLPQVWRANESWLADKKALLGAVGVSCLVLLISCFSSYSIDGTVPADRMAAQGQPESAAENMPDGDWQAYGRTAGGDRYSPLGQITPANVGKLKRAWLTRTGDVQQAGEGTVAGPDQGHEFNLEVTPIKIDNTRTCARPIAG